MPDQSPIQVAYLSYDGLTDPLGQSQIMPYVEGLSKFNYGFTVFSFEKNPRFGDKRDEVETWAQNNHVEWIPLTYHKRPPVLSTLFDLLVLWLAFKKSHRDKDFKIVHCRSYVTSLVGLRARRVLGVKFIFDMRGFWADERVEGKLWNLKNPVYKIAFSFFKGKEKQFLREADHIISLTQNAKEEIESWDINTAPIAVIPTCVDLDWFDPKKIQQTEKDALRQSLGIRSDDYVLLYLGSWGTWYMTEEMLDFFSQLKKVKPNSKFLIVSADKIDLIAYPDSGDVIVRYASRQIVPLYISIAQVAICLIKPSFAKKASSATKIGEIMAMDIPITSNGGWGDVERMEEAGVLKFINRVYENDEKPKGRDFCKENFDLRKGVLAINNIYNALAR